MITKPEPYKYAPSLFGIKGGSTGFGTKLCIAASGLGEHQDIGDFSDIEVFIGGDNKPDDILGISTMYAGIIRAKNKNGLTGIASKSKLYYSKCINEKQFCSSNSVISSILWGCVQGVDVMILDVIPSKNNEYFDNALNKAADLGILVITKEKSCYENLFTIYSQKGDNLSIEQVDDKVYFNIPKKKPYTTYLNNKYTIPDDGILATSLAAGLALLTIQKNKKNKIDYTPKSVYEQLLAL